MNVKYPFEYELEPTNVEKGTHWLTLRLKNIGVETLRRLDVQMHSLDTYSVTIDNKGQYIADLKPNEKREFLIRLSVGGSAEVYVIIHGRGEGRHFWWDSGHIQVTVIEEKAKFERFFVLSSPYTSIGKALEVEATIKGLQKSSGLTLEFWVDTPSGKFEELVKIETSELDVGEEAKYIAEITPKETGYYTVYAYLFDGWRSIDHRTDHLYVIAPVIKQ